MKRFAWMGVLFLLLVAALVARPARAGVADSPLPVLLAGETTYHLYSVPGVMSLSCFGTYFSCTSLDTAPMQVGVECFFNPGGPPSNDAVATSLSVAPGASATFGTESAADFGISSNIVFPTNGSCRILSTSKKLMCTAFVSDVCFSPVTFMRQLTIIKKKTQKGD